MLQRRDDILGFDASDVRHLLDGNGAFPVFEEVEHNACPVAAVRDEAEV